MLKTLSVQNYALIDQLELHFGDKTKKCVIEGGFTITPDVKIFLVTSELDSDNELIIHREINKDGKSRSFINDTPVNLSQLKELGNLLVDIHSQHETLLLNQSGFQLSVVDAFASHTKLLNDYRQIFKEYRSAKQELLQLQEEEKKLKANQDYLQFQFNELHEANLVADEQLKFEDEFSSLSHAEEIKSNINYFSQVISGNENNLLSGLSNATNMLAGLLKYSPRLNDFVNRLKAVQIELKDIEYEIEQLSESFSPDPKRLEIINDRLNVIYRLQQKHRLDNINSLIELRESFNEKLLSYNSLGEKIEFKTKETEKLFQQVKNNADKISEDRQKVIPSIESKIKKQLAELGMPNAVLKIEMSQLSDEELNAKGKDKVKFLFSANKGIPFSDISKVASGGELSRLMLCLKASVAKLIELPSIVFDEIDTGVSGETAFKIGKVMQELSSNHQLISITHLPQIASRGEDHFFVYKEVIGKKTFTKVKKLSTDDRIVEIARMLSGDKPTSVAMENARELLNI